MPLRTMGLFVHRRRFERQRREAWRDADARQEE